MAATAIMRSSEPRHAGPRRAFTAVGRNQVRNIPEIEIGPVRYRQLAFATGVCSASWISASSDFSDGNSMTSSATLNAESQY